MKDRFKYRVWNKHQKKMFDVYQIDYYASLLYCETKEGTCHTFGFLGCEVMQCTGLKDKNDQLIFEGDKVSVSNIQNAVVIFHKGKFCVKSDGGYYSIGNFTRPLKITGNTHES